MSLRYAALGLLAQHPGSGYDLLKRFEASMANVWPATQSQLYGELNKLADAGLIEVTDVGPRGRKAYRVTEAGRAAAPPSEAAAMVAAAAEVPIPRSPRPIVVADYGAGTGLNSMLPMCAAITAPRRAANRIRLPALMSASRAAGG